MSYALQQSQTSRPLLFLLVGSADHLSPLTGATPTVTISKNGAAFAAPAGTVTEISAGWYKVAGNATDTATLGPLLLHATAASADPTDVQYEVVAFNPDDAVRFGLTALPNVASGSAGALPTTGTGANQLSVSAGLVTLAGVTHTGAVIPTVTAVTNAVDILQSAADKVWASASRTLTAFSTTLAQAVWDVLQSAVSVGSSMGLLVKTNLDTTVSSRLATSGYTVPPTTAAISTQVWSEPLPGSFGAGTAGARLNTAGTAADPWATALPGAYGSGTAGNIIGNRLDVTVSTRLATSSYSAPPSPATIAAAFIATTLTELAQATPAATPSINDCLMGPYMEWRNSTTGTASTKSIRNNAGTVVARGALSDDGTTFTKGQLVSGP